MPTLFSRGVNALGGAARSSAWILEGNEQGTDRPLRIYFAGGARQKDYFSRLAFGGKGREIDLDKQYFWQILLQSRFRRGQFDLAIIEGKGLHRLLYQSAGDFFVPLWLETIVDLPLRAANKGAREDLRRIRKHGLTWELRVDEAAVREFYDRLYLPTVTDRHGPNTHITQYADLAEQVSRRRAQLMLVNHGKLPVAGVVILSGDIPRLWLAGVRDSSNSYRRLGVVGATYVFPGDYLTQQGFKQMILGRTRCFLNDGVMQYKNKWNHAVSGHDIDGVILKPLSTAPGLLGFLMNQPFVSEQDGELVGNMFDFERSSDSKMAPPPVSLPRGARMRRFVLESRSDPPRFVLESDSLPAGGPEHD